MKFNVTFVLVVLGFIAFPYIFGPLTSGVPLARGNKVDSRFDTYYKNYKGIYYLSTTNPYLMIECGVNWAYLEDVDKDSFVVLSNEWAKDATHVWNRGNLFSDADVASFRVTETGVPVDKSNIFKMDGFTYVPSKSGADPETVEYFVYNIIGVLMSDWLRDKNYVYYNDEKIDVDRNSFKELEPDFFVDKNYIYKWDVKSGVITVDSVQSPILALNNGYIRNGRNVIFQDKIILKDIDIYKFESAGGCKCIINDMLFNYGELTFDEE